MRKIAVYLCIMCMVCLSACGKKTPEPVSSDSSSEASIIDNSAAEIIDDVDIPSNESSEADSEEQITDAVEDAVEAASEVANQSSDNVPTEDSKRDSTEQSDSSSEATTNQESDTYVVRSDYSGSVITVSSSGGAVMLDKGTYKIVSLTGNCVFTFANYTVPTDSPYNYSEQYDYSSNKESAADFSKSVPNCAIVRVSSGSVSFVKN